MRTRLRYLKTGTRGQLQSKAVFVSPEPTTPESKERFVVVHINTEALTFTITWLSSNVVVCKGQAANLYQVKRDVRRFLQELGAPFVTEKRFWKDANKEARSKALL